MNKFSAVRYAPMKALILAAGQGKRLLPLTAKTPKALLNVGGKSVLAWQVERLVKGGIEEIVVVVGFGARTVEGVLDSLRREHPRCRIRALCNPYYDGSDNLVSCWVARSEMNRDFLLLNGDTLFHESVLRRLLDSPLAPVTLAFDRKDRYDDDDMKIRREGGRLLEIGKSLSSDRIDGESIGMLLFRGEGPRRFADALTAAMADRRAAKEWYLSVVDSLARSNLVETRCVCGLGWCEIDYPLDLVEARRLVDRWRDSEPAEPSLASTG